jgi:hypothetical protein
VSNVDDFLNDPRRLMTDDGSDLDHRTDKPHLYALPALCQRLRPVLGELPASVFECLAIDRELVILASASPREPWSGPHDELDPIAHGSYSCRGRYLHDPVMFRLEFSLPSPWVIKLGKIEVEIAPQDVFAGVVIHECMHAYLDHNYGLGGPDRAAIQQFEDAAVARACELGFRPQTVMYLDFYATRFARPDLIMGRLPPNGL